MVATIKDIPQLARQYYLEKAKTCFGGYKCEWSVELCAAHISEALANKDMYVTIEKRGKIIIGACGAALVRTIVPPHPLVVTEWMWYGSDRKASVRVWHQCLAWGKVNGAVLAHYVINRGCQCSSANPRKWVEQYQWRVL